MTLLIIVIALAFVFDFINGFHDAANSIATIVSTKVLSPFTAVIWAAFFNIVAYWISEFKVADTVAKTVNPASITLVVICAGLVAAIAWNLLTWWWGISSSSSHTLIGGFAGAAIAHAGFSVVNLEKVGKTVAFIFLAPLIGMVIAYAISVIMLWICRHSNARKADKYFKRLQLLSSAAFSIGHGGNDAQKVMGIISAALMVYVSQATAQGIDVPHWMIVGQHIDPVTGKAAIKTIPIWVVMGCYSAIGLGTLMGGWRIVKTMGSKITKITPFEGVAAETAGAITLFATEKLGIPVSTTHTITGSIIGVGITKRVSAVRWGITVNLLWAWILTIPVTAVLAAIIFFVLNALI
jgi:PiT family inorganic phosphate transporter